MLSDAVLHQYTILAAEFSELHSKAIDPINFPVRRRCMIILLTATVFKTKQYLYIICSRDALIRDWLIIGWLIIGVQQSANND